MRLNLDQQKIVVASARQQMQRWYDDRLAEDGQNIERYCLFWAFFLMRAMHQAGLKEAQIQAGTAYWPTVAPEHDDGICDNQYGYRFTWDRLAQSKLIMGEQPEMHVWVAIAKHPVEIADLTAPFFKRRAIQEGRKWAHSDPPDFLWTEPPLPHGVIYQADMQAIEIAYSMLTSAIKGTPLQVRYLRPVEG
jgi:hypothetical protein